MLNAAKPHAIQLAGIPFDGFTGDALVEFLIAQSVGGSGGYLVTPNVDNMRAIRHDPALKKRALDADVRVADGMPLVWASRIQGTPLPTRVAGSDLVGMLAPAIARAGLKLFLLGGAPGVTQRAAQVLRERHPDLHIVGTHCPPFGFERDACAQDEIRSMLVEAQPDFVYVALPFPKTSVLVNDLRSALPGTWFLGIGISLSFVTGDVNRAPTWMRRAGLEWIHRMVQEPRRLGHRYIVECLPFAVRLLCEATAARLRTSNGVDELASSQNPAN